MISERVLNAGLLVAIAFGLDWWVCREARKVRERATRRQFDGNRRPQ